MEAVDVRGRFMWHQLLTRDVEGARKFYTNLIGWKAQPWPLDPAFTIFTAGDVPTAGLMAMTADVPAEARPHWLQYIGTRDVDGTADAAVRAGGSILKPPSDMKGAGRYAILRDPQGAVFAVIDPEKARIEPGGMVPPLGAFSWHELATTDHEAAFAFYHQLFGWEAITRMDMGPIGTYLIFGQMGVQKGGMYIKPPDMPASPNWLPYAHVSSVDDAVALIQAAGGSIVQPPMEVPGGSRIAVLMDPAGAAFAIHSFPATSMPVTAPAAQARPKKKAKTKSPSKAPVKAKPKAKTKVKAKSAAKRASARKTSTKPKRAAKVKARPGSKAKTRGKTQARRKRPAHQKSKAVRRKK